MPVFEEFLRKNQASVNKQNLTEFLNQNHSEIGPELTGQINALDPKVTLTLTGAATMPTTNADRNARVTVRNGTQVLDLGFAKARQLLDTLVGLERIFNPALTGAFEAARTPTEDMRYGFATTKFSGDHIAPLTSKTTPALKAAATQIGERRMINPAGAPAVVGGPAQPAFTNIGTSSIMDLHGDQTLRSLKDEIGERQAEYEAIYAYQTASGKRQEILLQGEQEEVVFTTRQGFDFYETTRGATPANDLVVTKYAKNHLRYSVQKVGPAWKLHHMAGRVAPGTINVPPNGNFQAMDYARIPAIKAQSGTFTRIG